MLSTKLFSQKKQRSVLLLTQSGVSTSTISCHMSPGIFRAVISQILQGIKGARAYQDNIIVFGRTRQEHDENLRQFLNTLSDHNIQINMNRSKFADSKLRYLGYILSAQEISTNKSKIEALKAASMLDTPKKMRSFLGYAQYYSRFVPQFPKLAKPFKTLYETSAILHD